MTPHAGAGTDLAAKDLFLKGLWEPVLGQNKAGSQELIPGLPQRWRGCNSSRSYHHHLPTCLSAERWHSNPCTPKWDVGLNHCIQCPPAFPSHRQRFHQTTPLAFLVPNQLNPSWSTYFQINPNAYILYIFKFIFLLLPISFSLALEYWKLIDHSHSPSAMCSMILKHILFFFKKSAM